MKVEEVKVECLKMGADTIRTFELDEDPPEDQVKKLFDDLNSGGQDLPVENVPRLAWPSKQFEYIKRDGKKLTIGRLPPHPIAQPTY